MYISDQICMETIKQPSAIFAQNTRPNGNLQFAVVERMPTDSLEMIWPDDNANGKWRFVQMVYPNIETNTQ